MAKSVVETKITARDYVFQLLGALKDVWPIARGLKVLVEKGNVDDQTIDSLVDIFTQVIDSLSKESEKNVFKQWLSMLNKIKHKEMLTKETEERDLESLEETIANM